MTPDHVLGLARITRCAKTIAFFNEKTSINAISKRISTKMLNGNSNIGHNRRLIRLSSKSEILNKEVLGHIVNI